MNNALSVSESQIPAAISTLSQTLVRISGITEDLENRLSGVMRAKMPPPVSPPTEATETRVTLAGRLDDLDRLASQVFIDLAGILDRLEV